MPRPADIPWTRDRQSAGKRQSAARSMIVARSALNGPLPSAILHDTALDILLRLFVADDHASSIAALQADLAGSGTVVMRWIAALEQDDLIALDGPACRLTGKGQVAMGGAIDAVIQSQIDLFGTAIHA